MKFRIVLLLIATLAVLSNCKRRNRGQRYAEKGKKRWSIENKSNQNKVSRKLSKEPTWNADAEKRSRYSEAFLDQYEPQHNKLKTDAFDKEIVSDYATENSPVFWKDIEQGDLGLKKEEEGLPPEGFQQAGDELPSTVGPNENIYGGFPINDVIGGFELPSPETLAVLKLALKQHGPRNEYEATLHHDLENWAYGYEHHALPEYDIKETPPFYVAILQGLKLMQENKSAPGCKEAKPGCGPMIPLTNDQCNTLAGNCMPSKPITSDGFEKPCPWKILEWIYGCKEPKRPTTSEKPDETEPPVPPPPKPDKPEKPVEAKPVNVKPEKTEEPKPTEKAPQKTQEEEKPSKKPKPIPIQFNTFHGEKLAADIKDDMSSTRDSSSALVSGNSTLSEELGILANLSNKDSKAAAREKEKSTATSSGEGLTNTNNTSESKLHVDSSQMPDIALEIDNEQSSLKSSQSELITKGKPEPAKEPAKEPPLQTDFSVWSDWSHCSVSCGKGSLSRTRRCLNWKCDGRVIDLLPCSMPQCPEYLSWSEWSACESKCGIGRSVRTRKCSGLKCSGMSSEQKACFRDPCESKVPNSKQISSVSKLIQAMGAPWTEWSPCSAKFAGFGFQTRKRDCKKGNCNLNLNLVQSKACLRQNHSVVENLLNNTMPTNVQQACLYIHNSYRLPHGADELKWSDYLATAAKKLANNLARNSTTSEQVKQYELPGTSILVLPVGDSSNIGQEAACVASAKLWYGENKNYNFNQPHLTSNNRHFTQMIWKASKTLGLATAQPNPSGRLYFVAMYDPPGNQDTYVGFKKNALPLQLQRRNGVDYEDTPIVRRTRYKPQWP